MLDALFIQPRTPDDLTNLELLIQQVIENQDELARLDNNEQRESAIEGWAAGFEVTISKEQIQKLLNVPTTQNIEEIEALLLENEDKVLHPAAKLALQTSLMLAAVYWTPELFLFYTSKEILKTLLTPAIGETGVKVADGIVTSISLSYGLPNQLTLVNNSVPASIDGLQTIFRVPSYIAAHLAAAALLPHASAPVKALLAKAGHVVTEIADSEFVETAGDFFDLMHGTSGDDARDAYLFERYKGTLATSTSLPEFASIVASDVKSSVRWLYNCLPSRRTATTPSDAEKTENERLEIIARLSMH